VTTDLHVSTGAYACDALPPEEHRAARAHLRVCQACTTEARSLRQTATLLAVAAAVTPPPTLRTRVLLAAAATPQLRVVDRPRAVSARARAFSRPRWALGAAASLAALTIAVGVATVGSIQQPGDDRVAQASSSTVSAIGGHGSATVTVAGPGRQLTFTARGLENPGADRTYQLWLVEDHDARSAGTFTVSEKHGSTRIINRPGNAETLTVTEEPAGGSVHPTSAPILVLALPSST
jgi:hypothetical protein